MFIPTEGVAIEPRSKLLAKGVRLRSRAQLSGCVEWAGALLWGQVGGWSSRVCSACEGGRCGG